MTFDRRTIEPTPGRRMSIDLLVPPDLREIDLDVPPGPRSAPMLERAAAALDAWRPREEGADIARERIRSARELRRGERSLTGDGPLVERSAADLTSDEDVERVIGAERVAERVAADGRITLDDIGAIHAAVVGSNSAEAWRSHVIWMGDRSGPDTEQPFQPAAPDRIAAAMSALEQFLERDGNPVTRAAVTFAQLPIIHPWGDGNGRTGRLLADATLAAALPHAGRGPRVSDWLASRFHAAQHGLDAWRLGGDLDSWVAMYAGAVVQCCEYDAKATRKRRILSWKSSR